MDGDSLAKRLHRFAGYIKVIKGYRLEKTQQVIDFNQKTRECLPSQSL
jgi:hypothetical protein